MRTLPLRSLLVVACLLPAWTGGFSQQGHQPGSEGVPDSMSEKILQSDTPVYLETQADKAILYLVRTRVPESPKTEAVYLDESPLAYLIPESYIATTVEPGLHLLWGQGIKGELIEFEAGRVYHLGIRRRLGLGAMADSESDSAVDTSDPKIGTADAARLVAGDTATLQDFVTALGFPHLTTTDEGIAALSERLTSSKYEEALEHAGTPWRVTLPAEFSNVSYLREEKLKKPPKELKGMGFDVFTWKAEKAGSLFIDRERLRSVSKKRTIEIPIAAIQTLGIRSDDWQIGTEDRWLLVIKYRIEQEVKDARFDTHGEHNRILLTILEAMESVRSSDQKIVPDR